MNCRLPLYFFLLFLFSHQISRASNESIKTSLKRPILPISKNAKTLVIDPGAGGILYVNKLVNGGDGSGSSWANAIPELADAMLWAKQNESRWENTPLQIWVAAATYFPKYRPDDFSGANPSDRYNSFLLAKNVKIYGGFSGSESVLSERNIGSNPTIISGDYLGDDEVTGSGATLTIDNNSENVHHLFIAITNLGDATLDGLHLRGGAGSVWGSDTLALGNETIREGTGNGIYLKNTSLIVSNCYFTGNTGSGGASIYSYLSTVMVSKCTFTHNIGTWGMISANESNFTIANSLFTNNYAEVYGAGVDFSGQASSNLVINSTFVNNATNRTFDVGVSASNAAVKVYNSVILNTSQNTNPGAGLTSQGSSLDIKSSLIQGLSGTTDGNVNATGVTESQVFVDHANQNYGIKYTGPAFNKGSNALYMQYIQNPSTDTDLKGNIRLVDTSIEMGATESPEVVLPLTATLITDSGISNSDRITNDATPTFEGLTEPGASVSLFANGQILGQSMADGNGNWSITVITSLQDGNYEVTASGSKPGFVSLPIPALHITVDTTSPIISGVENGETYNTSKLINFNEGAGELNGAAFMNGGIVGVNGSYTLVVKDVAGNSSSVSFTIARPAVQPGTGNIIYVNKSVVGGAGTGDSWTNATTELADALVYAQNNKSQWTATNKLQIWVASGTYKPLYSPADNNFGNSAGRDNSFLMVKNVDVYGGFSGNETTLEARNLALPRSILDGDLIGNDAQNLTGEEYMTAATRQDNAHHVLLWVENYEAGAGFTSEKGSILDGFTVMNGNANGFGGTTLFVNGMEIPRSGGGGIKASRSNPYLKNIIFKGNSGYYGGAIYASIGVNGGVMYYNKSIVANSLFDKNHGNYGGSAIYASGTLLSASNNTYANHTYGNGYIGNVIYGGRVKIVNSILLDTNIRALQTGNGSFDPVDYSVVSYSIVSGNTNMSNGNLDASNLIPTDVFTNPAAGDYSLKPGSAAIDAGSNMGYEELGLSFLDKDLAGNARVGGGVIDMGAYEIEVPCPVIASPVATSEQAFCISALISNLQANPASNTTLAWYTTATGGSRLAANTALTHGSTYYASSELVGCASNVRTPVTVTINAQPNEPIVSDVEWVMGENATPLTAIAEPGHTLRWYEHWNDTTAISTPTPSTAVLGRTYYYVSQVGPGGCESDKAEIVVFVKATVLNPTPAGIIYVNKHVTGGNKSGDSWANAVQELADVLEYAQNDASIKEVWVAKGTYNPLYDGYGDYFDDDEYNVLPIQNLKLYGGFNGTETRLTQRNWKDNPTILSGDIGVLNDQSDNTRSLVISNDAAMETVLDGFIIEKTFGGSGLTIDEGTAGHIINHCIFRDNEGGIGAGVFVVDSDNVTIANSLFLRNLAAVGGALVSIQENPAYNTNIVNCLFVNNEAEDFGGATVNIGSLNIQNSIAWGNKANGSTTVVGADFTPADGDLMTDEPTVSNTITQVYTNSTPGARTASGAIVADPLFTNPTASDFTLQPGSPAINAGDNNLYDETILGNRDLNGVDRIRDNNLDLGVFEVQTGNSPLPLKLLTFKGKQENATVMLSWQTADEVNTLLFEIERSLNGKAFETAGKVHAGFEGNHQYQFADLAYTLSAKTYYRLKMMDVDGTFAYSNIIALNPDGKMESNSLKVYPNPAVSGGKVTLETDIATTATLYDLTGRSLQIVKLNAGMNHFTLPNLTSGVYLLHTSDGKVEKVVVAK